MAASEKKPSLIQRMTPNELIDAQRAATRSADGTKLPGHISGPNDALRHIIGAAELRRRYGPVAALAILEANEFRGNRYDKQTPEIQGESVMGAGAPSLGKASDASGRRSIPATNSASSP